MKCYASKYCKKFESGVCNQYCDLKIKLDAIYKESHIPERYKYEVPLYPRSDIEEFKRLKAYQDNIVDFVSNGESLLISSATTGNGKTTWATKLANQYIRKTVATSLIENEVLFINVSMFLEQMRSAYKVEDEEFEAIKERAFTCKLLILDDLGAERPSDWVLERLYDLINERYVNMRSTICTSNFTRIELAERLGMRIGSRLRDFTSVEFKETDVRGRV